MDFKDRRGVSKTESLFHETIQPNVRKNYTPIYSLRDYDNKGFPSAYNIYMTSIDERDAALKLVGSMSHWRKLCSLNWFMVGRTEVQFEGLIQWRLDMAARDATEARRVLQDQMKDNNVTAARAVLAETKKVKPSASAKSKSSTSDSDSNITNFLDKFDKNKDG